MKHQQYFPLFYIILLSILFISTKESDITDNEKNEGKMDYHLFISLISDIFKVVDKDCFEEIQNMISELYNKIVENKRMYPWILDSMGKGLNDLGDERECRKSLLNTTYILAKLNKFEYIYDSDINLAEFLEIKNFTFGMCIMKKCEKSYKKYFKRFLEFINIVADNKTNYNYDLNNIVDYFETETSEESNYKIAILYIFACYVFIKVIVGLLRLLFIPKGYDKYVFETFGEDGKSDNIDQEEKETFFQKDLNNTILIDELETYFPFKLKIMRFFDFFNDVMLLITKKNRLYNDNGLEVIVFMKTIVVYFHVFFGTFSSLVSLPSPEVFNREFFSSYLIFFYKISINSFTCWITLEGAYTTYKLMKYIKTQFYEYHKKRQKYSDVRLLIVCGKFILLFLPKIIFFFIIYYFFYFDVQKFDYLMITKNIYKYIIDYILRKDIECNENPFKNLLSTIFTRDMKYFNACFEFTFVFRNILICSLIFMMIIFFSFVLRSKLFDKIIMILNVFFFFVSMLFIVDEKTKLDGKYNYYHLSGQKYSNKFFYVSLGFYYLGYVFGFLLFHYDNNQYEEQINKKNEIKLEEEENKLNENNDEKDNHNNLSINEFNLNYYPFSFFNTFLHWLTNVKDNLKIISLLICLSLIILLTMGFQIYLNFEIKNFQIKLSKLIYIYFLYEKHIFIILFLIINVILLTWSNKGLLKIISDSYFFIAVSRIGFSIICISHFFNYFSYCFFFIKVKYHLPTFMLISIGNFLLYFVACFLINVVVELPLRLMVKKILRIKRK